MTEIEETARALADAAEAQPATARKPVMACFIGEAHMKEAQRIFSERSIPTYPTPERTAAAMQAMVAQANWWPNRCRNSRSLRWIVRRWPASLPRCELMAG